MTSVGDNIVVSVEAVLVPTLVIFVIGWLIGALNILAPSSVFAFNMAVLYWVFPSAIFSGFLEYRLLGQDFLYLLPVTIVKFLSCFPAFFPYIFGKKIDFRTACMCWLTGLFNDPLIFGPTLLGVFYNDPAVTSYCSLITIPNDVLFFPTIVFLIEYYDYKKQLAEGREVNTSGLKILLSVILRTARNPLVWSGIGGLILNQVVLAPGGKFPEWFKRIFTMGAQCTLPLSVFLVGVFTATYHPIHKNVMRLICCIMSPCKSIFASEKGNEAAGMQTSRSGEENLGAGGVDGSSNAPVNADPPSARSLTAQAEEGVGVGMGRASRATADQVFPVVVELEAEVEAEMEEEIEEPNYVDVEKGKRNEHPSPVQALPPGPAPASASSSRPEEKLPEGEANYKFSWGLFVFEVLQRHVISPVLMLLISLAFHTSLQNVQKHSMVILMCFSAATPVFALSRQYNVSPGEAALNQILGMFILTLPLFLAFYYISQAVWPLD